MACRAFKADGVSGILCGLRSPRPALCSQPRHPSVHRMWIGSELRSSAGHDHCPFPAVALCDYPIGKGRTCSAKICGAHRTKAGIDVDHCPAHAGMLTLPGVL